MEELEEMVNEMAIAQKRYYQFCETIERKIREVAAEVYPELLEGNTQELLDFKYMFVSDIQHMQNKIEKVLQQREDNGSHKS